MPDGVYENSQIKSVSNDFMRRLEAESDAEMQGRNVPVLH
jgi:hypothetical protein